MRILSVLSAWGENMRNRTQHGLSWLTAISDAGSTPAASTNIFRFDSLVFSALYLTVVVNSCHKSLPTVRQPESISASLLRHTSSPMLGWLGRGIVPA
jgi:hypothetical protein